MTTGDRRRRPASRVRWVTPIFSLVAGIAFWIACAIGGHPGTGAVSFAVLAAFGSIFVFGGRSETVRAMRGDGTDERWRSIDLRSTAVSGMAMGGFCIVASLVELARGVQSGGPYPTICAIGGVAYLIAYFALRRRS